MATLYESNTTTNSQGSNGVFRDTRYKAQNFTPSISHIITSVTLRLHKVDGGNLGTNITVSIQGVDGSNKPDGTDLVSATLATADVQEYNNTPRDFSISLGAGTALTADTKYAIICQVAGDAGSYIRWWYNTSSVYAGGNLITSENSGSTWTHDTAKDFWFEEYGTTGTSVDKTYSKRLVAVGNNEVWYEATAGTMSVLAAASGAIDSAAPLTITEAFQKVFVANETNLKVIDFANSKIVTDAVGTNNPDRGNILTGGSSQAAMIVDYITSTADACTIYGYRTTAATFTAGETVTGTDDDSNAISFAMTAVAEVAAPHWYDWTVYANDTTNFGTMPTSAYIVCRYRGRCVLSGHPNYPHQWYMSKVTNPFNFVYGPTDPLTAVAGNNIDAGEIGDIVRALIPYGDDYLIFGCTNSIHLLTGDPAFSGQIDEIDESTGIFSPWSWCKDGQSNLYFWGANGIYKMEGGRSKPINISEGFLPKLVDDWAVDPSTHRIVFSYDPINNGIIISKTTLADGTNLNYFFDLKTEGFYPETYPEECAVFSNFFYDSDSTTTKGLILGCNDGYLRRFDYTAKDDDIGNTNEAISSYVTLEMILMNGKDDSEGKLTSLTIELGGGLATTKLTHAALTTAHAKGDTLTQATSAATMIVAFSNTAKTLTFGHSATGTFNTANAVTSDGVGTGFTPTAVGTGDFSDTDGVSYELHVADDAETCLEKIRDGATPHTTGSLSGSGRKRIRPRVRGRWLGIKFYNSTELETFVINLVSGELKPAGKLK